VAIKFNVSGIAEPVKRAILRLEVQGSLAQGTKICSLFVITREWVSKECTWMNAAKNQPWSNMGGDFSRDGMATCCAGTAGGIEIYDVTRYVNEFITGQRKNNGFLLEPASDTRDPGTSMKSHYYYSSEYKNIQSRPSLILETE